MFGNNNVNVGQIVQGHINEITNKENELYNQRIVICKQCPLFTNKKFVGYICDHRKYYNPETEELSDLPQPGFIGGCGCRLEAKTRLKNATCVLNKW